MVRATTTDEYVPQRVELQRVAAHVLARRRFSVTGRFGLRATAGGIATPMFGNDEVLRITNGALVWERRTDGALLTTAMTIDGTTLAGLAAFAEVDLAAEFSVGHDSPPIGDRDAPITLLASTVSAIGDWFTLGARALDRVVVAHPSGAASAAQLWPEHFDLAIDLATATGRVNVGTSAGDGYCETPYAYVGPWEAARPGDSSFWNASFGASITQADLSVDADPLTALVAFFERGLGLLS